MIRKDCDNRIARRMSATWLLAACVLFACASDASASSIRLWPSALVVSESIRLDDVCELSGFTAEVSEKLSRLIVTGSPVAGGSRAVSIDLLRSVVATSGTNMSRVTIGGALTCQVSRPSQLAAANVGRGDRRRVSSFSKTSARVGAAAVETTDTPRTLRQAVVEFCNAQVSRFGGVADVTFGRTAERLLELAEPEYAFKVRTRGPTVVGLVPLEVSVLSGDRLVQSVPMVVQVILSRRVLVARRTINQGASIASLDLEMVDLSFGRTDAIGMVDASQAIGQRARRVVPAGTAIQTDMLEPVPVIRRGQLVTLTSVSGSIQVVTTGKAAADGLLGDVIKVRSVEDRRVEFDALVTGPGQVRIGGGRSFSGQIALGGSN